MHIALDVIALLTHFNPIFHFYNPKKRQKTFDFMFPTCIEEVLGLKLVNALHIFPLAEKSSGSFLKNLADFQRNFCCRPKKIYERYAI